MKILVINSGSSSIKYQVIDMPSQKLICKGLIEQIGSKDSTVHYSKNDFAIKESQKVDSYDTGLQIIIDYLQNKEHGVISNLKEIAGIGHRVVHGGRSYTHSTLINDDVKKEIKNNFPLAPVHNPANLEGIVMAEKKFPDAKQVAVFDTAFHQTLPLKVKKYAIPNDLYENNEIQVYGFHGTSHKYVSEQAIDYLQNPSAKIISIHLGNGCSMTAIDKGKSVDHSLGFAPGNGLIMGTRSGDIDHGIIFHLVNELGYSLEDVNNMLLKNSGMLALTGFSDMREIQGEIDKGNETCLLAMEMYAYRIKKFIGSYAAAMNGLDAIIFTAGIGENSSFVRKMVCDNLSFLGILLDEKKNEIKSKNIISVEKDNAHVKILVIPTNEELEIANQTYRLVETK